MTITIICLLIFAYLLGSIPTAVWIGKGFYKIDVREHGSGNAGATNTFRVLGKKAGIPVLMIDILKGFVAAFFLVMLQSKFSSGPEHIIPYTNLKLAFGFAAVLGHVFPLFAGFRGGKGIATLLGIVLAIHPPAALSCIAIFLLVLIISKYVSLGSLIAGVCFPILVIFVFGSRVPALMIFSGVVAILIIMTHQKNIERLLKRNENKTYLIKVKKRKIAGLNDDEEVDEYSK